MYMPVETTQLINQLSFDTAGGCLRRLRDHAIFVGLILSGLHEQPSPRPVAFFSVPQLEKIGQVRSLLSNTDSLNHFTPNICRTDFGLKNTVLIVHSSQRTLSTSRRSYYLAPELLALDDRSF